MLLAVVAMSVTYSFAQNANSGVTVVQNQGVLGFGGSDCDGNFILATLVTSNTVTKANGSKKYTATHNFQDQCNLPSQPEKVVLPSFFAQLLFGYDSFEFMITPGGMVHSVGRSAPTQP